MWLYHIHGFLKRCRTQNNHLQKVSLSKVSTVDIKDLKDLTWTYETTSSMNIGLLVCISKKEYWKKYMIAILLFLCRLNGLRPLIMRDYLQHHEFSTSFITYNRFSHMQPPFNATEKTKCLTNCSPIHGSIKTDQPHIHIHTQTNYDIFIFSGLAKRKKKKSEREKRTNFYSFSRMLLCRCVPSNTVVRCC